MRRLRPRPRPCLPSACAQLCTTCGPLADPQKCIKGPKHSADMSLDTVTPQAWHTFSDNSGLMTRDMTLVMQAPMSCMRTCMHNTQLHTHTRTRTHTHTNTHEHAHTHTHTHAQSHTRTHTHAHTSFVRHTHTHTHERAHKHTSTHTHTRVHTHTHTNAHTTTQAHTHTLVYTHTHTVHTHTCHRFISVVMFGQHVVTYDVPTP